MDITLQVFEIDPERHGETKEKPVGTMVMEVGDDFIVMASDRPGSPKREWLRIHLNRIGGEKE